MKVLGLVIGWLVSIGAALVGAYVISLYLDLSAAGFRPGAGLDEAEKVIDVMVQKALLHVGVAGIVFALFVNPTLFKALPVLKNYPLRLGIGVVLAVVIVAVGLMPILGVGVAPGASPG